MASLSESDLSFLAAELTLGCRILAEQEIIDAFGHLSLRLPGQPDLYMINRGMSPSLVRPEDFIVCDLAGLVVDGDGHPNGEWPIHSGIFAARPDVQCVLHSHSRMSRIFSLSTQKLRGLLTSSAPEWQGGLPLYRAPGLITSLEKGRALAQTLGSHSAALLRGHGDVVVGASVRATVLKAISLKQNADVLHEVLSHSPTIELWSDEDLAAWGNPAPASVSDEAIAAKKNKAWDYYAARVDGTLGRLLHKPYVFDTCPCCGYEPTRRAAIAED